MVPELASRPYSLEDIRDVAGVYWRDGDSKNEVVSVPGTRLLAGLLAIGHISLPEQAHESGGAFPDFDLPQANRIGGYDTFLRKNAVLIPNLVVQERKISSFLCNINLVRVSAHNHDDPACFTYSVQYGKLEEFLGAASGDASRELLALQLSRRRPSGQPSLFTLLLLCLDGLACMRAGGKDVGDTPGLTLSELIWGPYLEECSDDLRYIAKLLCKSEKADHHPIAETVADYLSSIEGLKTPCERVMEYRRLGAKENPDGDFFTNERKLRRVFPYSADYRKITNMLSVFAATGMVAFSFPLSKEVVLGDAAGSESGRILIESLRDEYGCHAY